MAGTLSSPGCLAGGDPATIIGVEDTLDLRLADHRLLHLPGIAVRPPNGVSSAMNSVVARWLVGRSVRVAPMASGPDRWGRTVGLVFAAEPSSEAMSEPAVSVSEALLEAGLAVARPSAVVRPCWATYLALESGAREKRQGLWADPSGIIVDAEDRAALQARFGTFALVEGRARTLHEGPARTYVRMTDGIGGMAITIERRMALRLAKDGVEPEAWVGRRLRVRGFLDDRWGLQIEVTSPQQVEVLGP